MFNIIRSLLVLLTVTMPVYASVSLGSNTGVFQKITNFFQSIVDFLGGTGTLFVIFISAAAAIILWIMAPKEGSAAIAWIFRVCIGAIGLFSLGTLITSLQGF
ncbi:hypothetical protein VSAK1_26620 [Vibrio mediterranei AK1]|uniref:hypothetical protein n=1 Tax=Vibrio mediterranei TaxID=689 RepID=UPI0001542D82|nr:hypothetical protein [Vibrio mediterranei]EDL52202.1 hypothetical protein VSAK1_26620 [Vibrio mediterranei AK1]